MKLYNKLIHQLGSYTDRINFSLYWDEGQGMVQQDGYLFDLLEDFDITFDVYITVVKGFQGDFFTPPDVSYDKEQVFLSNVEVIEKGEGHRVELSGYQRNVVERLLTGIINY